MHRSTQARVTTLLLALCLSCPTPLLAGTGGDECDQAQLATEKVANEFDTSTATPSPNPPEDGPCEFLDWQSSKDVWFEWHPSATGFATIDLCSSDYDTSVVVYRGSCDELGFVACDDDSCGAGFRSIITDMEVDAAFVYYIRIGGWEADSGAGSFTIAIDPVAPECLTSTGKCNEVHGGAGCNDVACCGVVCLADPLCCEVSWSEACVDAAVLYCGYFVHECMAGGPANDCATSAMVVVDDDAKAFDTTAANTDGPNEAGCNSARSDLQVWHDLWYVFVAPGNGLATASCCNAATFDTKIVAYELPGSYGAFDPDDLPDQYVGCNEDGDGCDLFTSTLDFDVTVGQTYLVRVGGYLGESGTGTISFSLPDPCALPSGSHTEGEACGGATNDGCNGIDFPVEALALGSSVEGTFWSSDGERDTDWYEFTIEEETQVTWSVHSATSATTTIVDATCPATVLAVGAGECPSTVSTCLAPGTYRAFVATSAFDGTPCGSGDLNAYVGSLTGAAVRCPSSGDVCLDQGPDDVTQNKSIVVATGGIACAGQGLSAATTYARSFDEFGGGEIRCVTFGWSNTGFPVAATLGIYRDTNGGAPTNVGDDLVLVAEREFALPTSDPAEFHAYFDEAICIEDTRDPVVIVLDVAASTTGFASYAGNAIGSTAPTYIRADGCGIPEFVTLSSIGFPDENWVVVLNGDLSKCNAPTPCAGDLDADGEVGPIDLGILLGAWGGEGPADLNGDGDVGPQDLGILLGAWGPCPTG